MRNEFLKHGEYAAAGLYEECDRGLFYRKALAVRRFYENCELAIYRGEALYPSGKTEQKMKMRADYFWGISGDSRMNEICDPKVLDRFRAEFRRYHSSVPKEHTVAGDMYTHSMPNYRRILEEGLASYIPRIEKIEDKDMREGLLHLVEGIKCYVSRCVDYLKSVNADDRLVEALSKVPLYPAENIYEAIVSWNFVMYLDNCDNLGCLGQGLLPYYKGEDIVPLLENLYDNLDINGGYSMSLDSECPSLAVKCLKAAHGRRRPMIELLVDEDTHDDVWQAAFDTIKSGGQPAFYNKKAIFEGLMKRFPNVRPEDVKYFCGGGCTESMISGMSAVGSLDAGINLLLIFERVLYSGLPTANSFDEFYKSYIDGVEEVVENVKTEISRSRRLRAEYNPVPMRTLLIDDCIDKGTEYNSGGARYNWSIINFAGLINVIDSMINVKEFVFRTKKYTAEEFLERLKRGDGCFLDEMMAADKSFGKDIDEVNEFSHRLSADIFGMTERGELAFGEGFLAASIQFQSQAGAGRRVGATPDGRRAGEVLCDSLGAIFGKDVYGPTALLNSVTALDLGGALGTPVLNFNINEKFKTPILKAMILGYIRQGGIQMQITYASREELLDAREHPERHGNLIVRVGGYSEYFNRLPDDLKQMIINRTIQNGD